MIHFKKSKEFQEWLVSLRRNPARARVNDKAR
jgi:putative component of toxin-antitoxin plasmid stabilization module